MPNANVLKKRAQVKASSTAKAKVKAQPKSTKPKAVPAKTAGGVEFKVNDRINGCTFADINQFVKDHAGGSMANVQVVPLATPAEVPFGWGGQKPETGLGIGRVAKQTGGVRATMQTIVLKGGSLQDVVATVKAHKCGGNALWSVRALLNGDNTRSAKPHWGTSFIKLVVQPAK
tara:strand:+ start:247 stop:768 length:522 start_codon:yes stop_codon:yes gene_type:complete